MRSTDRTEAIGVARALGGDLDATVVRWGDRWITLLTTNRNGRPVALAVEVGPVLDEPRTETAKRLVRRLREWAKVMPDDAPPIVATDFRSLPLGTFMRARSDMARDEDGSLNLNPWNFAPARAESHAAASLVDALTYVRAAEQGASPVGAIAEAWGITLSSAEGRIARARARGFLTEVGRGNQERSVLTEEALHYREEVAQMLPQQIRDEWRRRATEHKEERYYN